MSWDLTRFGTAELRQCDAALRDALGGERSMESAARTLCRSLYEELAGPAGERAGVLVRCYKTPPYGALPADLQRFAKRAFGAVAITPPDPAMPCLTLLATVGDEPAWNDRRASRGHQAIPLPSPHVVERAPMIAQLVRELGFDLAHVAGPLGRGDAEPADRRYGVFHVEEAAGSPYIPAQAAFVDRHGVRSVLGFGGALGAGELFAAILFARVPVPVDTADRFRTLASEIGGLLAAREARVFDDDPPRAAR